MNLYICESSKLTKFGLAFFFKSSSRISLCFNAIAVRTGIPYTARNEYKSAEFIIGTRGLKGQINITLNTQQWSHAFVGYVWRSCSLNREITRSSVNG